MGMTNHFTRGGQLALHRLRMFSQIAFTTCCIAGCLSLLFFGIRAYQTLNPTQWRHYLDYCQAKLLLSLPHEDPRRVLQDFVDARGKVLQVPSLRLLQMPAVLSNKQQVERHLYRLGLEAFWMFGLIVAGVGGYFLYRGRVQFKKTLERGAQIVSSKTLEKTLHWKEASSTLFLDKLPLARTSETSHFLVTGTTGSGKTNLFHSLVPQVRERGDSAIVVDLTGDFVARYFRPETDLLFNPFDTRSVYWDLFEDCCHETQVDSLAEALIPQRFSQDPFWEDAARSVLAAALRKMRQKGDASISGLYHLLVESSIDAYQAFFKQTVAASLTDKAGERMTLSIRSTLANYVGCLAYLPDPAVHTPSFSIRKWVQAPQGWIFLTARADQRKTLKPLLSAVLDTAMNALLTLPPDAKRRCWFFMDELPALQRLPSLDLALAESRKYGGCLAAGIQSYPQLSHIYGNSCAQAIVDLFNTKIFFRSTDPQTTQWISRVLGEQEATQIQENLSYGAHAIRDGVSLSQLQLQKALVLPTEIATLENLSCYIK
ncbi:MAG: type IV secretion system DNA-binding domain-containing protein, partial [Alphaproteobacteria bacterium]